LIGRELLLGSDSSRDFQGILLGFQRNKAVAFVIKSAKLGVGITAYGTERPVDHIETGDHLVDILQPGVVRDIDQPEHLDIGLAKDDPLPAELEEHIHGGREASDRACDPDGGAIHPLALLRCLRRPSGSIKGDQ
jgi:hypothetical protein